MDRFEVTAALRELAARLAASGADRYRVRAYEGAARGLEQTKGDLERLVDEDRLTEVPGIGAKLAAVITELVRTGTSAQLEKLRREVTLPDVTPGEEPMILGDALEQEARLLDYLRDSPAVKRAEAAGELRRRLEVLTRLDFVVATTKPKAALDRFCKLPGLADVVERSASEAVILLAEGIRARALAVTPARFAMVWLRESAAPVHVEALEDRARKRKVRIAAKTEEALYERLGLAYVPVELRDGIGEVAEAARSKDAFADLVTQEDVRGYVHCHTHYSDGVASVEAMVRAAKERGREYITITDHSPTAHYAGGVQPDRLKKQWRDIEKAQDKHGIRVLRGTESDILKDGSLDYPDRVLAKLDVIVASIHQRYKLDGRQMTKRIVTAMRHPFFKIWGHGLGRLLLKRPPVQCDVEAVLDALAESRGAIEINGDPHRLDLEPRWVRAARERGIRFVLSTDAHSTSNLDFLETSVMMARRGGVRRGEVLNALSAEEFVEAVRPAA